MQDPWGLLQEEHPARAAFTEQHTPFRQALEAQEVLEAQRDPPESGVDTIEVGEMEPGGQEYPTVQLPLQTEVVRPEELP